MKRRCDYDAFDEYYLDAFQNLAKHEDIAVARAIFYCKTHEICPPAWLVAKVAMLLLDLLKKETGQKDGRSRLSRFKYDYWKFERWEAVETVLSIREGAKNDDLDLKSDPDYSPSKEWQKLYNRRKDWLKLGTYDCAAKILEGEYSHSSSSSIKQGHAEVRKEKSQGGSLVGLWFDDNFLELLGVKKAQTKRRTKKARLF